jgi:hypothetical protein
MMDPWTAEHFNRPSSQMTNYSNFSTASRFTAREPEQIADYLRGDFEPAHVSTRPGPGGSNLSFHTKFSLFTIFF